MSYRNKTYVAFASEDILQYRLMEAWKANQNIDFDFFDAHDLFISRDTSKPETIKKNLTDRLKNAKQVVLLGSVVGKRKGSDEKSFLAHEIKLIIDLGLPIVIANLDGDRKIDKNHIPNPLIEKNYYTMSVSFQPKIIKYALDNYAADFSSASKEKKGNYYYLESVYAELKL
ncbi:TIR domain-containing protein [Janthinobacterium sp. PSPC3-1]|uniref:TIR domain-containing protein n=1 Tax=Janthinobacterium sp. PSPC3-1 TaxID=2804653 RepID=UPI003CE76C0E